jgi:hypothetical protein
LLRHSESPLEAGYHAGNSLNFEEGYEITFHSSEVRFRNILIIKTAINILGNKIEGQNGQG